MLSFPRKLFTPPPEGYFCMPVRYAIILGLASLLYAVVSHGQALTCTASQVCLSWSATTGNTDGSLLSTAQKPITYLVYRQGSPTSIAQTQGLAIKLVSEPRGEQCYALQAVDALSVGSALTGYVCTIVRFPGPSDGVIEKPTDGSIESRPFTSGE